MTYNLGKSLHEFLNPALTFEHQTVELCTQLFEMGLAEHKRRETEVNSFFIGQTQAVTDYQQKALQTLANFEQQHNKVKNGYTNLYSQLSKPGISILQQTINMSCIHTALEDDGV